MKKVRNCQKYLVNKFSMPSGDARKICLTYALPWRKDEQGSYLDSAILDTQGKVWMRDIQWAWRSKGLI